MITLTPVSLPLLPYFSVGLFPIPLALNVLSSLICSVGGAGDIVGGGDCSDSGAEQVSQVQ